MATHVANWTRTVLSEGLLVSTLSTTGPQETCAFKPRLSPQARLSSQARGCERGQEVVVGQEGLLGHWWRGVHLSVVYKVLKWHFHFSDASWKP